MRVRGLGYILQYLSAITRKTSVDNVYASICSHALVDSGFKQIYVAYWTIETEPNQGSAEHYPIALCDS